MFIERQVRSAADPRVAYQIGDVAERAGLSVRTVRYYEEAGLVVPVARTVGGFRLYEHDAVDRLLLIKKMKALGFTLAETKTLLALRDELADPELAPERREDLEERLRTWVVLAEEKLAGLRQQVGVAESFVVGLHEASDQPAPHGDRPPDGPDRAGS